jgi:type IV secretion system protein VirB6
MSKSQLNLIFLIFLLLIMQRNLSADDGNAANESVSTSHFQSLATTPGCLIDGGALAALIGGVVGGVIEVATGIPQIISGNAFLVVPDPTFITKVKGVALITTGSISIGVGIGAITYAALGGAGFGQCALSFVRDPVDYYPDTLPPDSKYYGMVGTIKYPIKNSNGDTIDFSNIKSQSYKGLDCKREENCYFMGMPAPSSDKITVCARRASYMPGLLGNPKSCYGLPINGSATVAFGLGDIFKKNPYYNGPNSIFCPEEFRQLGRWPNSLPESDGYYKLKCQETDITKCPGDAVPESFKKDSTNGLQKFKLIMTEPYCKTSIKGDTISISGYKYKIVQKGTKLCAVLSGLLGGIPWTQSYEIGCIPKMNLNLVPKCASSVPICSDKTTDKNGFIINNGCNNPVASIIGYDDSPCSASCAISQLCTAKVRNIFESSVPITSYLMGCIKDSVGGTIYGCNNSLTTPTAQPVNNLGLLRTMQIRMRPIIFAIITLSVILFGMQLLLFDSLPKMSEIMAYLLKLAFVFYITNVTGKDNGMERYFNYMEQIGGALQSYVISGDGKRGLCDYSKVNYVKSVPKAGKYLEQDFSYLKPWDTLDCRMMYYLFPWGMLANAYYSTISQFSGSPFEIFIATMNAGPKAILFPIAWILFFIFLLFMVIQVCQLMILSILGLGVLVILSPVFVPLILFKSTKQIFDSWISQTITYSLYPVLLFAFLGFMFLVTDQIAFGQTTFSQDTRKVSGAEKLIFKTDMPQNFSQSSCKGFQVASDQNSIGRGKILPGCDCNGIICNMTAIMVKTGNADNIGQVTSGKINITEGSPAEKKFQIGTLGIVFVMFIFYHFSKLLPSITQSLAGTTKALMSGGGQIRSAHSRMEGLAKMAAGSVTARNKGKSDDKASRTSITTNDNNSTQASSNSGNTSNST